MTDAGGRSGDHVELVDARDVADLATFLSRARRLDAAEVRLQATGRVLAATVCALAGHGLMGEGTVLGLRAVALAKEATCDVVVGIDAVHDRLARLRAAAEAEPSRENVPQRLALPPVPVVVPWTGVAPPRAGWEPIGVLPGAVVERTAEDGIAEIAAARTEQVRESVWGRTIPGTSVPAGSALAVHALGFTAPEIAVFACGRWHRLSTPAGHVLAR